MSKRKKQYVYMKEKYKDYDKENYNNNVLIEFYKELLESLKFLTIFYQLNNCKKLISTDDKTIINNSNGLDYGKAIQDAIIELKTL